MFEEQYFDRKNGIFFDKELTQNTFVGNHVFPMLITIKHAPNPNGLGLMSLGI